MARIAGSKALSLHGWCKSNTGFQSQIQTLCARSSNKSMEMAATGKFLFQAVQEACQCVFYRCHLDDNEVSGCQTSPELAVILTIHLETNSGSLAREREKGTTFSLPVYVNLL